MKSQISPHFLFNTLNNFYVELYDENPQIANDILRLSQLLRYVTYETADDFVSLKKEIQFIEDYLHFYKRRYEESFSVDFNVVGVVEAQKIASLILIHFVENVCKHGIVNDKTRKAKITIAVSNEMLELTTENFKNTAIKHEATGIGSANIKKRLTLLYKGNYILEEETENDIFKVYLKLNC